MQDCRRFLSLVWVSVILAGCYDGNPDRIRPNVKVLTLNTWLLPLAAKNIDSRLKTMPEELSKTQADLVALQEVWTESYKNFLISEMKTRGYSYADFSDKKKDQNLTYFNSKGRSTLFGNGLVVISKFPLTIKNVLEFEAFTSPDEAFTTKGMIHLEADLPSGQKIDFYTAHFGSVRFDIVSGSFDSEQTRSLIKQVHQAYDFIRSTRLHSVQILAADLNSHPLDWNPQNKSFMPSLTSEPYRLMTQEFSFTDTFARLQKKSLPTYDTKQNSNILETLAAGEPSQCLDYIFINSNQDVLEPTQSKVVFDEKVDIGTEKTQISDHFGIETQFELK